MPYQFDELPASRKLGYDPPSASTKWCCEGIFDDLTVGTVARTAIPFSFIHPFAQLYRQNVEIEEVGHKVYHLTASYGRDKIEVGSYRFSFDQIGGSVHVKAGVHQAVYPTGKPTHNGLIGVKGDGDVEGVDIVIPAMKVTVHFSHPGGYIDASLLATLSRLPGSVSTEQFFNWVPYETLFLGATGSQGAEITNLGTDVTTDIDYHFAMSENLVNFAIGGVTGISKKGWDVAWVKWIDATVGGLPTNQADYVNVVTVYKEKPLKTILGFG